MQAWVVCIMVRTFDCLGFRFDCLSRLAFVCHLTGYDRSVISSKLYICVCVCVCVCVPTRVCVCVCKCAHLCP